MQITAGLPENSIFPETKTSETPMRLCFPAECSPDQSSSPKAKCLCFYTRQHWKVMYTFLFQADEHFRKEQKSKQVGKQKDGCLHIRLPTQTAGWYIPDS
jgi:hypothetical protein